MNAPAESRKAAADLVYLVSCAVNGEIPDPGRTEACDLAEVYLLAKRHYLAAAADIALESAGIRIPAFVQARAKALRKNALLDSETAAVAAALSERGIWYMPLKGAVLQRYYPQYGMREMSDRDILFDASRARDVRQMMEALGFQAKSYGYENVDVYYKPPVLNFEMHRTLVARGHSRKLFNYYQAVEKRLLPAGGLERRFTPEDFYIFLLVHEFRHYSHGGIGLRALLDVYVYLRREQPDMARVRKELDGLGLRQFEEKNRLLAQQLFERRPLSEEQEEMLDYILSSGSFGRFDHIVENQLAQKGRLSYFLTKLILPMDLMRDRYPVLGRAPFLYPFCWFHRAVYSLLYRRDRIRCEIRALAGKAEKRPNKCPSVF